MTEVFVLLQEWDHENGITLGVFSTNKKAKKAKKQCEAEHHTGDFRIEPFTLDVLK